ncbi:CYtochrome P450 family [Aphelenchoides besseyi]|nr:CYtochrome P450 family [Aphelenchoides besseyi]
MLIVLLIFLFFFYHLYWKRLNWPNGPTPLPIVGNLLEVMFNEPGEKVYAKWNKKFGGVFTFYLGDEPVIMITDPKKMVEMFVRDADSYSSRSIYRERYGEYMKLARGGCRGITFGDGESWKELRTFAQQTFKQLGMGTNLMQEIIFLDLCDTFEKLDNSAPNLCQQIDLTITSIICNLCYGRRVTKESEREFRMLLKETNRAMRLFAHPANLFLQRNPEVFKHLPYFSGHLKASAEAIGYVNQWMKKQILMKEEKLQDILPEDIVVTDFLSAFIKQRGTSERKEIYNDKEFVSLAGDLWFAGQDTSSETIKWAVAYLIHNPQIQLKAQQEVDSNIGSNRLISLDDKKKFTILLGSHERRIANILPLNLLHSTTRDVQINGHMVKKRNRYCASNLRFIDRSDQSFNPDRFVKKKIGEFFPFGLGKRSCMGESLGRSMVFLILINLLNRYTITPGTSGPPSLKRRAGLTCHCDEFDCCLEKRLHISRGD